MSGVSLEVDISLPVRAGMVGTYQSVIDAEGRPIAYVAMGMHDKCRATFLADLINATQGCVSAPFTGETA